MKITCNPKDISKILNVMASAASEDPTRTNIQGVNVIAKDTMLMFQSTNGHYAFKITVELNESVADQTFVMAPQRVQEILAQAKVDAKYKKDLVEYDLGNETRDFPRFDRLGFGDKAKKTFILQSLESDWNWSEPTYTTSTFTPRVNVDRYAAFFSVRQRAVSDARRDTAHTNVSVWHAIEPNRIVDAYVNSNRRRLVRDIAYRMQPDMIAYSCYDSTIDTFSWTADYATWVATYSPLFRQALQRIKKMFPGVPIYISEVGWPENEAPPGFDITDMCGVIKDIAEDEGCKYMIYWLVFDNEGSPPPANRGYWLVKPDGTLSEAGIAFQAFGPGI